MEKENYLSAKKQIELESVRLLNLSKELRNQYIEENKLYSIGQKVKITTPKHEAWSFSRKNKNEIFIVEEQQRYAFVSGYDIDYNGDVVCIFIKMKKDGTPSKQRDYFGRDEIISIV